MDNETPAKDIKRVDLLRNTAAFVACLRLVPPFTHVVDIRYGLGNWARELLSRFPNSSVVGYEIDKPTWEKSYRDKKIVLHNCRYGGQKLFCDLLLADFNHQTALTAEPLREAIHDLNPTSIIFTDVACGKLAINYRAYKLEKPSLKLYWQKFPLRGYELLGFYKFNPRASTSAWTKK